MPNAEPFHPIADLFPLLGDDELTSLAADIATNGLLNPIWRMPDGRIIDGRNRFRACKMVNVEPRYDEYDGDSPLAFVVSMNERRRHLSTSQRAMIAAKVANLPRGVRADRVSKPQGRSNDLPIDPPITQPQAASTMAVSTPSVKRAAAVLKLGTPELVEAVETNRVTVDAAAKIAKLPKTEQRKALKAQKPHVANNSGQNEWYTPPEYIDAARRAMGGIDCDPASTAKANKIVKAEIYYTAKQDGLQRTWGKRVWMNPPYAQPLCSRFSEGLVSRVNKKEVKTACILVNNATETVWFRAIVSVASAIVFPSGRVKFLAPDGNPGAPLQGQAVLYVGNKPETFLREFADFGWGAAM